MSLFLNVSFNFPDRPFLLWLFLGFSFKGQGPRRRFTEFFLSRFFYRFSQEPSRFFSVMYLVNDAWTSNNIFSLLENGNSVFIVTSWKKTIEQLTWTELYRVLPSCFAPRSRPYPSPTFVCWARIATPSPSRIDASWWRPSASRPPSLPPPAGPHFSCLFNRVPLPCSGLLTVGKLTWLEKTVGQVNRVGWREITSVQSTA